VTAPVQYRGHRPRPELGLSNSKLEGLNSKIRLINHRGYGHHSAAAIIAMICLCCGGLTITLPNTKVRRTGFQHAWFWDCMTSTTR